MTPARAGCSTRCVGATLTLLLAAGGAVLAAELVLRARHAPVSYTALFVDDDSLGYTCASGFDAPVRSGTTRLLRSDAEGVFDRSGRGAPSLLVLGDAAIAGLELDARRRLAARLGDALHRQTVNLGCPGYGTLQEALLMRRWQGRLARGGAVIVAFNLTSDVFDNVPEWEGPNIPGITRSATGDVQLRLPHRRSWLARQVASLAKATRLYGAYSLRHDQGSAVVMMPQQRWLFEDTPPPDIARGLSALALSATLLQRAADAAGLRVVPIVWVDWGAVPGPGRAAAVARALKRVEQETGWHFANGSGLREPRDLASWERRMFAVGTRHASAEGVDSVRAEIVAALRSVPGQS